MNILWGLMTAALLSSAPEVDSLDAQTLENAKVLSQEESGPRAEPEEAPQCTPPPPEPFSREELRQMLRFGAGNPLRLVPNYGDDKRPLGLAVFGASPGGAAARMGLCNRDILVRIWDVEALSAGERMAELQERVDTEDSLRFEVIRAGRPVELRRSFTSAAREVLDWEVLAGKKVTHSRDGGVGSGRWAAWDETHWLTYVEDGRRVGLRIAGGGGNPEASAAFVSFKGQPLPTEPERDLLLRWARWAPFQKDDARDQLAAAPWFRHEPVQQGSTEASPTAFVHLESGKEVRFDALGVPLVPQRASWRSDNALPSMDVGSELTVSCPCYSIFSGDKFKPWKVVESGAAELHQFETDARNPTCAFALRDTRTNSAQWLGKHFGAVAALGAHRGLWWFSGAYPLDDRGLNLFVVDPARGSVRSIAIQASRGRVVALTSTGISIAATYFDGRDEAEHRAELAWSVLEELLAHPGARKQIRAP